MKDVEKIDIERENSSKRLRRRRRNMGLYSLVVIILVMSMAIVFSCTFLFNIKSLNVHGDLEKYTEEEILGSLTVKVGDNLVRLDTDKIEEELLEKWDYLESVDVEITYPSTLDIYLEESVPAFNISYELGTLVISGKGKILENSVQINKDLTIFYGYVPSVSQCGLLVDTNDEKKKEIFDEFIQIMYEKGEQNNIASVDMTSTSNIIITFKDGNVFKMGNSNDFEYKLTLAEKVIEEVDGKVGYITMIGSNQCSFRTTDGSFTSNVITTEAVLTGTATTETTTVSDEDFDGDFDRNETVTETVTTETLSRDEQLFREHDERVFGTTQSATENIDDDYYSED